MKYLKAFYFFPVFMLLTVFAAPQQVKAQTQQPPETTTPATTDPATTDPNVQQVQPVPEAQPAPGVPWEDPYDQSMRLGYAASQAGDPSTAVIYFSNALAIRPGDRLATIAYWNMIDQLERMGATEPDAAPTGEATDYDRFMRIGYEASANRDYQTALINFQRALNERPNDPYAAQAVLNVSTYIERER